MKKKLDLKKSEEIMEDFVEDRNTALMHTLIDKGWNKDEISEVLELVTKMPETSKSSILDKIGYWIALLILIFGNFLISVLLIPFMMFTKGLFLYLLATFLGLTFGLLYNIMIKDIERLDKDNRIMSGLFIAALAVINIYIIAAVSNHMVNVVKLNQANDPFLICYLYVIGFVLPYIVLFFKNRAWRQEENTKEDAEMVD